MKKFSIFLFMVFVVSVPSIALAASKKTSSEPKPFKTQSKITSKSLAKTKADMDCKDFTTWQDAQSVYESNGGLSNDIYDLDRDHDGIACEDLKK